METVADTIREITKKHLLESNGLLYGQCVTAVGWIGGTVPELTEKDGIVELPTSDSSNPAIVCGAALMGRRPIYVIRYQGFMCYNAVTLLNYAAKSKTLWNEPCPVFIRSIAMEGSIGPVASNSNHSMIIHHPGMPVIAPMTPLEWTNGWNYFLRHDDPIYCSEHRKSFTIDYEMSNIIHENPVVTIIGISNGRIEAIEATKQLNHKNIKTNLFHQVWLKPFKPSNDLLLSIKSSRITIIVDSGFQTCGISESIAYNLIHMTNSNSIYAFAIADKTAGFSTETDNLTPSSLQIFNFAIERLKK